jgi:hypothetical protein
MTRAPSSTGSDKYTINLHYIRAAIEANTGVRLSLARTRELLVEEGLITQDQARRNAQPFTGYADFFDTEISSSPPKATRDAARIAKKLHEDR